MLDHSHISIIIPTFNRGNLIHETLDSILNQTYTYWECIVVDDGSTDDTDLIMEKYALADKRFHYYKRPEYKPKGANACRNYGFEKSKGQYIQWFDSDDIMDSQKLKLQMSAIEDGEKQIAICDFQMFRDHIIPFGPLKANLVQDGHQLFAQFIAGDSILNTPIILWPRTVVSNNSFDETLSRAQDLDFVYRVLKCNIQNIIVQPHILCSIRIHDKSITSTYHKGDKQSIDSEISVRKRIFYENYRNSNSTYVKQGVLKGLISSFKALVLNNYYQDFKSNIISLKKDVAFDVQLKLYGIIFLGYIYKHTGRGMYLYGKLAKSL